MVEAEAKENEVYEEDLVDYDDEVENGADAAATNGSADVVKKYVLRGGLWLLGFVVGRSDLTDWNFAVCGQGVRGDPQLGVQRLPAQAGASPCHPGLWI